MRILPQCGKFRNIYGSVRKTSQQQLIPIAEYVAQEKRQETEKRLQQRIVRALEDAGYQVLQFAGAGGHGALQGSLPSYLPDLLVKDALMVPIWLEVKTPRGKLQKEQQQMHQLLDYYGWRVAVVRSPEEALNAIKRVSEVIRVKKQ